MLRVSAQQQVLVLTLHHIIADGLSVGLVLRELGALHAAFIIGQESPLPRAADPVCRLRHLAAAVADRRTIGTQLAFWRGQLAGIPTRLELPTDRPRPVRRSERAGTVAMQLGIDLVSALSALGRREGVTLYMTLLAAFQLLLRRYAGQDEIVVGSPAGAGRSHRPRSLVGFRQHAGAAHALQKTPRFASCCRRCARRR